MERSNRGLRKLPSTVQFWSTVSTVVTVRDKNTPQPTVLHSFSLVFLYNIRSFLIMAEETVNIASDDSIVITEIDSDGKTWKRGCQCDEHDENDKWIECTVDDYHV